jgi:trimethylamine--corrinoid protein Co-methyltransferase
LPIQSIEGGFLKILTKRDLRKIHEATLDVLENVGVTIYEEEALDLLRGVGANVDNENKIVKIPRYLIEEAIKKSPSSIRLCGRNPNNDIILEGRRVYTAGGADGIYVIDLENGKLRLATLKDLQDLTRLQDSLDNIHAIMGIVNPSDVSPIGVDRLRCCELIKNTEKHILRDAQGKDGVKDQIEIAAVVVGSREELKKRPIISFVDCTTSPLKHEKINTEVLIEAAKNNIPIVVESDVVAGATAPVTIAGALIVQNAEVLSGILIAQLENPGTPVIYGNMSSIMDMRTANVALGSPELGIIQVITAQLCQEFYEIPFMGCGGISDSKSTDAQASLEKTLTLAQAALAGTNLIHEMAGMLDSLFTVSYEQVVIDDEIMGAIYRILKGTKVTDETLAIDVIADVGPLGSHFLTKDHTRKFLRQEQWIPGILIREKRESWERKGSKSMREMAREKAKKILKEHWPEQLEKDLVFRMEEIVKKALKKK